MIMCTQKVGVLLHIEHYISKYNALDTVLNEAL